ncbi:hypothetical protein H2203_001488 [Taxawa tesnikishii (nom. ined.)]|nr:hypothetical protein H2203_001488 [Dothideales sp. JES 119]
MDAGGLAQMTYNGFPSAGLGVPGSGFASRGNRGANPKRLSVALPPKVSSINENQVDNPTPRTSRSHLLAGLRTAPKTPSVPASAPYNQTQHQAQGLAASKWADNGYNTYNQGVPQTATGAAFPNNNYGMNAGHQMYSLPEQVLAPPTYYGQDDEMDPNVLEQLQLTGMFLAQRQQQLQQQLANITAAANQFQGLNLNTNLMRQQTHQQSPMTPMTPQNGFYGQQQQIQSPIEVAGQPGVYLVYNPMTGQYQYAMDTAVQQQAAQSMMSPVSQGSAIFGSLPSSPPQYDSPTPAFRAEISPPPTEKPTPMSSRSITPPKKSPSPPSALSHASSLALGNNNTVSDGPKTSTAATFGSARSVFPPTPMTATFAPGAGRAGEHPIRQPRNPPNIEELVAAPTSKHEGSKNFATRQRRRALDSLVRAGSFRRGVSRSSNASPVSEGSAAFFDGEGVSRIQSPIGSERQMKRNSQDSLEAPSSAVQTPASEYSEFETPSKQPPVPAQQGQERRRMMMGLLNAAEKRKSGIF